MKTLLRFLLLAGLLLAGLRLPAAERIPAAPSRYFNDYAGVVSPQVADRLNAQLEQFERDSSNQLVVAIYPKMESDSSVEDYTVRVAQAWGVGQKGRNNGAVLFSFMQERQLYLQVGYGLEGAIPDATAKRIIEREIVPRFRQRDIDGGMTAAVNAMIAASKGEYRGTGRTQAEQKRTARPVVGLVPSFIAIGITLFVLGLIIRSILRGASHRPTILLNPHRLPHQPHHPWWMGSGGRSGRSSWGGGGSFGGGGFSGGGGSFGGGGAGGKW